MIDIKLKYELGADNQALSINFYLMDLYEKVYRILQTTKKDSPSAWRKIGILYGIIIAMDECVTHWWNQKYYNPEELINYKKRHLFESKDWRIQGMLEKLEKYYNEQEELPF